MAGGPRRVESSQGRIQNQGTSTARGPQGRRVNQVPSSPTPAGSVNGIFKPPVRKAAQPVIKKQEPPHSDF